MFKFIKVTNGRIENITKMRGRGQWNKNNMNELNFSFLWWIINKFILKLINQGRIYKQSVQNSQTGPVFQGLIKKVFLSSMYAFLLGIILFLMHCFNLFLQNKEVYNLLKLFIQKFLLNDVVSSETNNFFLQRNNKIHIPYHINIK